MSPRRSEVYVLRGPEGALKIGRTHNLKQRVAQLQVGLPEPLVVEIAVPGTSLQERALHQTFVEDRIRGEWFRPSKALTDFLSYMQEGGSLETFLGAGCTTAHPPGPGGRDRSPLC